MNRSVAAINELFDEQLRKLHEGPGRVVNPLIRLEHGDGSLLWEAARGSARADRSEPLTPAHRFHVASIAKTMTAALIMRHAERGAFGARGIDARLVDLEVLPPSELARLGPSGHENSGELITLRHLLTHTSGMRDAMVDDATHLGGPAPGSLIGRLLGPGGDASRSWTPWDPAHPRDPEAGVVNFFLNSGISTAPLEAPGRLFHYSDTGFVLLGLVAERAGGEPLHAQLRRHLFAPLNLEDTYLAYRDDPPGLGPKRAPESDCWANDVPCLSAGVNLSFDWAGGGVVSTAKSLNAFLRSLLAGRLFERRATLEEMLSWQEPTGLQPPRSGVGLGIFRTDSPCGPLIGHSGAWGGKMFYSPRLDIHVAGTTNQSSGPANWHWDFLEAARTALSA